MANSKDITKSTIGNILLYGIIFIVLFYMMVSIDLLREQTRYSKELRDNCTAYLIVSQDTIFRHCFEECSEGVSR